MKRLLERAKSKEILDDLTCSGEAVSRNLKELDIINALLGGNNISVSAFKSVLKQSLRDQPLSIADLGCGSGQLMIEMDKVLIKKALQGKFTGFDANPFIVDYAKNHCKGHTNIQLVCSNVLTDTFSETYDIVHASLFLHHFEEEELVQLLNNLRSNTRMAIIINDLHRHPLAYYAIKGLTTLFSKSHMVKNDAALSVAKGFKRTEWEKLIRQSGFKKWEIKWVWAFRHRIILYP